MARHKTGRRADDTERKIAADWVALYRQAQLSPDGWVCVNPEDDPENQVSLYADDTDFLIGMLESFAEHGTFKNVDRHGLADMLLSWEFHDLKNKGHGYTEAIHALAEKHHCSTRTIERRLPTKRGTV